MVQIVSYIPVDGQLEPALDQCSNHSIPHRQSILLAQRYLVNARRDIDAQTEIEKESVRILTHAIDVLKELAVFLSVQDRRDLDLPNSEDFVLCRRITKDCWYMSLRDPYSESYWMAGSRFNLSYLYALFRGLSAIWAFALPLLTFLLVIRAVVVEMERIAELEMMRRSVHASLWESASHTSASLLSRLAIIHLIHEARGLDVNPKTIEKFRKAGDKESVDVLEVIHADEVTHVTAGHRWFMWMCQQKQKEQGLVVDPVLEFRNEARRCWRGDIKGPFNIEDREKAG
ncbi:DUF455-domain-containing protein [Gymnopus androsaceus JB14]|uniref:DUF455-domain-containing protein n=1 Tax=Gymnopus androsaceus JB14 TaxID=1447944 RepID=A0A6A4GXA4_9AGAR|nr:DUF455-domain-containing protein [Gymnopus androsaceus JB14]